MSGLFKPNLGSLINFFCTDLLLSVFINRANLTACMDHQVFGDGQPGSRGIWGLIGAVIDDVFVTGRKTPEPLDDKQLKIEMGSNSLRPHEADPMTVDHIILTGGFGSLPYVREAIKAAARRDSHVAGHKQAGSSKYTNLAGECIRLTDAPQLCVASGLVEAHTAQLLAPAAAESNKRNPNWLERTWFRVYRR